MDFNRSSRASRSEGGSEWEARSYRKRSPSPSRRRDRTPPRNDRSRGPSLRSASPHRRPTYRRRPASPNDRSPPPSRSIGLPNGSSRAMPWDAVAYGSRVVKYHMDVDDLSVMEFGRYPSGVPLAFKCEGVFLFLFSFSSFLVPMARC
jgi:hypothetical protein